MSKTCLRRPPGDLLLCSAAYDSNNLFDSWSIEEKQAHSCRRNVLTSDRSKVERLVAVTILSKHCLSSLGASSPLLVATLLPSRIVS